MLKAVQSAAAAVALTRQDPFLQLEGPRLAVSTQRLLNLRGRSEGETSFLFFFFSAFVLSCSDFSTDGVCPMKQRAQKHPPG